ncbi:MAG: tRNA (adenosine(37)-N6)-threonylcarbamoyltransferase complex ATPase subunit type 1 TsaE [Kiloniellales bacterium]|nr:tRNA (adenosine(37)-N6)-threonylcarbamoyltransferase complex ATPase subunit type 1 TsaE [Kiloniellales bacterium]
MTPGTKPPTKTVELALPDESATLALARGLAAHLQAGDVVFLIGELGAGKTTFARGVIGALPLAGNAASRGGEDEEVPSPTFTLVQIYERRPAPLWHVDLYRLTRPEEVEELGLDEAQGEAITLIEWPDRLGRRVPADRLEVRLTYGAVAEARSLVLAGYGSWARRLSAVVEPAPRVQ